MHDIEQLPLACNTLLTVSASYCCWKNECRLIYNLPHAHIRSREELLGEGCFGQVFSGEFPPGRPVAVKLLLQGSEGQRALKHELELLSRLQHPNVVRVLLLVLEAGSGVVQARVCTSHVTRGVVVPVPVLCEYLCECM
jgi:hypothetical protein